MNPMLAISVYLYFTKRTDVFGLFINILQMYWFIYWLTLLIGECTCEDTVGQCIMSAKSDVRYPPTNWSSCSSLDLKSSLTLEAFSCVYKRYGKGHWIHQNNLIIEYVKINTMLLYLYL